MKLYPIFTCEAFLYRVSDVAGGGWNSYGSSGELTIYVSEEEGSADKGCGFVTWRNTHARTLGLNTKIVFDNPISYNAKLKEATFKTASRVPLGNGMKNMYRIKFCSSSSNNSSSSDAGEKFVLLWRVLNQVKPGNVANAEARDEEAQQQGGKKLTMTTEDDILMEEKKKNKRMANNVVVTTKKDMRLSTTTTIAEEKEGIIQEQVDENETPKSYSSQFSDIDDDDAFGGDNNNNEEDFDVPMSQDWQSAFSF